MIHRKCKRFIESKGGRCGAPAEKRFIKGQFIGTFCYLCWLDTAETLAIELFGFDLSKLNAPTRRMIERQARHAIRVTIEELRSEYFERHQMRDIAAVVDERLARSN